MSWDSLRIASRVGAALTVGLLLFTPVLANSEGSAKKKGSASQSPATKGSAQQSTATKGFAQQSPGTKGLAVPWKYRLDVPLELSALHQDVSSIKVDCQICRTQMAITYKNGCKKNVGGKTTTIARGHSVALIQNGEGPDHVTVYIHDHVMEQAGPSELTPTTDPLMYFCRLMFNGKMIPPWTGENVPIQSKPADRTTPIMMRTGEVPN